MVITILDAHVEPDKWAALEQAYREAIQHQDRGLTQSFLLHSPKDTTLWQIATIWQSREALADMRSSGVTPRGVLIFRAAGAEPTLSVFDVVSHASWDPSEAD